MEAIEQLQVTELRQDLYQVANLSKNTIYKIDYSRANIDGHPTCTCPARKLCKHIKAVQQLRQEQMSETVKHNEPIETPTQAIVQAPQAMPTQIQRGSGMDQIVGRVLTSNGVHGLTTIERVQYYRFQCARLGLDRYSLPFDYVETSDKSGEKRLVLFPNQRATDQIRKNRGLSVKIVGRELLEEVAIVTAVCIEPDGRETEAIGTAELIDGYGKPLRGKSRAQAIEKADTRARRRATLAACGLSADFEEAGRVISAEIYDPPEDS